MFKLNISLPEQLQEFLEQQVVTGGYANTNEYINHLIRQEQERIAQKHLESMLIEGIESGEVVEITDEWWEQKRARLVEQLHQKQ
ncbi:type II toxin-antitoxin system ParD family antitoxin [Nostoc sp. FACHB-87]|uniref:type II toxin-antitoxin system ParD family antitoxin n=1 Tax=Nostocaceae TaxID=1162 RepID=UPI0016834CE6|nr:MULTISPECIES: type II toxin-antitoxin system ParD family antitoxin [Nostocaceae]MBD2298915.1 type II toxin-antitoxin system ParD family antitoxin [Nostoc sp. FACHB-190]MBD2453259.1 type II toxin-antitoxin system ParD family antitoxin [Nostoc sp. FACHB-87]MBD2474961.1 type II toxin-antitoxin system ParD family antitoxin [Anabaena sp. FACHB-83]